jgi:hypothetical protein
MSTSVELSAGLLKKFMEFTRRLSPEQLEAIVAGDLKFGILTPPPPKVPAPVLEVDKIAAELSVIPSREAARDYLDGLRLKVTDARKLAKAIDASITGATTKDAIRDRIIEHPVGARLNSHTIRYGTWSS